jgi:hypothetical protein
MQDREPVSRVFSLPGEEVTAPVSFDHDVQYSYFGGSVDISGDVIAAGAPLWNSPGEAAGSVEVFRRSEAGTWEKEATLTASDKDDGFQFDLFFGETVVVSGSTILVGAPGYDDPQVGDNTGAVYVFEYEGGLWVETGKLLPSGRAPGARYGKVLAYDAETLALAGYPDAGYVALFDRGGGAWSETALIPVPASPDGAPNFVYLDYYAGTLAVSTVTRPEVLDFEDISQLMRSGYVTIYEQTGGEWQPVFETGPQEAALYPMAGDRQFGLHISLGGRDSQARWLAVGKPGFPSPGGLYGQRLTGPGNPTPLPSPRETGSVALFERGSNGWYAHMELALEPGRDVPTALKIFADEIGASFFGAYVEFQGEQLAVISTFADAVHVFQLNPDEKGNETWTYTHRYSPAVGDDFMRRVVAMSRRTLVLGASGELGEGEIFIFEP